MGRQDKITRRQWLTHQAVVGGMKVGDAMKAVARTAIDYPEWDMDETHTWEFWQRQGAVPIGRRADVPRPVEPR